MIRRWVRCCDGTQMFPRSEMGYFTVKDFFLLFRVCFYRFKVLKFLCLHFINEKRSSGPLMAVEVMNVLEKPADKSNLWTFVSQTLPDLIALRRLYDLSLKHILHFYIDCKKYIFSSEGVTRERFNNQVLLSSLCML
jgi:hypothetical protein